MYYFRVKNTVKIFLLILIFQSIALAQLKKLSEPNMVSPVDIYLDDNGNRYSTLVTFKFKTLAINLPKGVTNATIDKITFPDVKNFMNALIKKYGSIEIEKAIPTAVWGDTIRINKRTGKTVFIKDMSQIFKLGFSNLVPVDSIADALENIPEIEYAQGPVPAYLVASPNDPYYQDSNYRWSFDVIEAEPAWDITKGSSNIKVSMNDEFGTLGQIHEDLIGKVVYRYSPSASGGHGTITSGVVGAITDNNLDIASLGWNTSVMFDNMYDPANEVNNAVANGADVINFSWIWYDYAPLATAIHNALLQGVVCVASAGNNETPIPGVRYPAAYNFGSDGQVLAVSCTILNSGQEEFLDGFNYSPGTDPINDPTNAFIDCSAPGTNYRALSPDGTTGTVHIWAATSVSAPFVSALVALILSVNSSLTPPQIYDIITNSADKIGQYSYDTNGWNQYMGYGRINAYKALKYTLEHYGGSLTQTLTIPSGETWNFQSGVTLTFSPSTSLIVNGTLNAIGNSSTRITFDRIGSSGQWGGIQFNSGSTGTISYADIQHATQGIYCSSTGNSSISISYCNIQNNYAYGIRLYNSSPAISSNNILTNGQYGIDCDYYSSPKVTVNTIKYHTAAGIKATNYSQPTGAAVYYGPGDNVIKDNNGYGLFAVYNSVIHFGSQGGGGDNSIYNNSSYEASAYYSSTIWGQYNWWGAYPPNPSEFYVYQSTIYNDYALSSDPNSDRQLIVTLDKVENADIKFSLVNNSSSSVDNELNSYIEIFRKEQNTLAGRYALIKIEECFRKANKEGFADFVNQEIFSRKGIKDELTVMGIELINHSLMDKGNFEAVKENLLKIKNELLLNENIEKHTLFALGQLYVNCIKDTAEAKKYFAELIGKYPEDLLAYDANIAMGSNSSKLFRGNDTDKEQTISKEAGEYFRLFENYPNPFNPTTKISYSLSEASFITLKVYDILGREIVTLVNENKPAGKYEVDFDASELPSGVYIYTLRVNGFVQNKKMVLLR